LVAVEHKQDANGFNGGGFKHEVQQR
jgi:hypothetical protein